MNEGAPRCVGEAAQRVDGTSTMDEIVALQQELVEDLAKAVR